MCFHSTVYSSRRMPVRGTHLHYIRNIDMAPWLHFGNKSLQDICTGAVWTEVTYYARNSMVLSSPSIDRHLNIQRTAWLKLGMHTQLQMIGNMAIDYTESYFTVVKVSSQGQLQMSGAPTGHRFNTNIVFPGTWIPITEIGRSWDLLILIMEISIPPIKRFHSETTPGCWYSTLALIALSVPSTSEHVLQVLENLLLSFNKGASCHPSKLSATHLFWPALYVCPNLPEAVRITMTS